MLKIGKRKQVECPGCLQSRIVNLSDWATRKSDYCKSCSVRVRVGLKPSNDPSEKGTPLHNIWCGMRQRCGHKKGGHDHDVKHYAERGIVVCDEWRVEFLPFKNWALANGFAEGLILDRRDNDKGYNPDNCRFVTVTESNRNKRTTLGHEKITQIRIELAAGKSYQAIAAKHDTSDELVRLIAKGKTWR